MPLYKAKCSGRYKDIGFAAGDVIDVDEKDAHVLGWDVENHVMEPYTEATPDAEPVPDQAPELSAPEEPADAGEGV